MAAVNWSGLTPAQQRVWADALFGKEEPTVAPDYYVVWGHGRSWVVHRVDGYGRITWASHWFSEKGEADAYLSSLCG